MSHSVNPIAAVQGAPGAVIQDLFRALVARWTKDAGIAGVIAEPHGLPDRACTAGYLRSVRSGKAYPIFQDLGPGSTSCHLDGTGALAVSQAVARDIAEGCDLVVLSKFGKLEAAKQGLFPAFAAAAEAGVAILTSVSPAFADSWAEFAAPLSVLLPADPAAIEAWWQAVRSRRPLPDGAIAQAR